MADTNTPNVPVDLEFEFDWENAQLEVSEASETDCCGWPFANGDKFCGGCGKQGPWPLLFELADED